MHTFKIFACEICEKTFSTNKNIVKHMSIIHGEEKKFECMYVLIEKKIFNLDNWTHSQIATFSSFRELCKVQVYGLDDCAVT